MINARAETARKVADIISDEPERFSMDTFRCGSIMCIAGHIGAMHNDWDGMHRTSPTCFWMERQAERIGLTLEAGRELFCNNDYAEMTNSELSAIMLHIAKNAENTDVLAAPPRLLAIVSEALQ